MPIGRLDPLVARLIGATTATRVGDGADWRFLGGRAGGLETEERKVVFFVIYIERFGKKQKLCRTKIKN